MRLEKAKARASKRAVCRYETQRAAIRAQRTLTVIKKKAGMFWRAAQDSTGRLVCVKSLCPNWYLIRYLKYSSARLRSSLSPRQTARGRGTAVTGVGTRRAGEHKADKKHLVASSSSSRCAAGQLDSHDPRRALFLQPDPPTRYIVKGSPLVYKR